MLDRTNRLEATRLSFLKESRFLRYSSPLFSALMHASASDSDMIKLGSVARPGQPVGQLFPIVAHYLLLKSPEPTLARYFLSLTEKPDDPGEAFPAFRHFCLERVDEFSDLLANRTVNTNLVERASCILPALKYVSDLIREPFTLVEMCCSVGLNLSFDKYHYDYGSAGKIGIDQSPVQLSCTVISSFRPPIDAIPAVAQRVGLDLTKVDISNPLDRLWMEAALCPEWQAEREHLRAALSIRAEDSIRIITGDALEVLTPLLSELQGPLCLLHSYCMGQWNELGKEKLDEILRSASCNRDIHRIGIEMLDQETPESLRNRLTKLVSVGISPFQKSLPSRIEHTLYAGMESGMNLIAHADGCGAWIDWKL